MRRFEPERGFAFSTYALWWVRHAIFRAMADLGHAVRIPVHAQEAARNPKNERQERMRDEVDAARATYSLDAPVDAVDNARGTFVDMMADGRAEAADDVMERDAAVAFVRESLELLPSEERAALELRMAGATLKDAARQLGISSDHVRRLEVQGMARIRARMVV